MTRHVGQDADPLNVECDACGAEVAEPCRPGCLGVAALEDAERERVLGRTTGGSPRVIAPE